jgi:hypothetical protein
MQEFLQTVSLFLSEDPALRLLQGVLLLLGVVDLFLLFFTLRDVLLRYESFWAQTAALLLVACAPVVGFFLYLLFRPSRTLWDHELRTLVEALKQGEQGRRKRDDAKTSS